MTGPDPQSVGPDPAERQSLRWEDACRAAALLAIDPSGLKGVACRAWPGPVRDLWRELLAEFFEGCPQRRVPVSISEDRLLGGLDLAATLASGRPVMAQGVLSGADGGLVTVSMGERMAPAIAAQIGQILDQQQVVTQRDGFTERRDCRIAVVLEDESADDEDQAPAALRDRLACWIDLEGLRVSTLAPCLIEPEDIRAARDRLDAVVVADEALDGVCKASQALGIVSMRAPLFALRLARANAALERRGAIAAEDLELAARLVLGPRARRMPESAEEQAREEPSPPPPEPPDTRDDQPEPNERDQSDGSLDDQILEAVAASLPPDILAGLIAGQGRRAGGRSKGKAAQVKARKGRPAGVRQGPPRTDERLHVLETLRAAAPWQRLRYGRVRRSDDRVIIRGDDFRTRRLRQRVESTTIFVVDASGSSAVNRLAEVKGAIELILADCYIRRDRVALVAFRGPGAEIILPPTSSLTRAKKCLSALPAGGGTPLASGLDVAFQLTQAVQRQGSRPLVVLLTDGGANLTLTGEAGRGPARDDALTVAQRYRAGGFASMVVDTSPRGGGKARDIAQAMGARHLPLPHANAQSLSSVVQARTTLDSGAV